MSSSAIRGLQCPPGFSNAPFPGRRNGCWLGVVTSRETSGGMFSITVINWSCLESIAPGFFRNSPIACCPHSQYCPLPRFVFICMIYLRCDNDYIYTRSLRPSWRYDYPIFLDFTHQHFFSQPYNALLSVHQLVENSDMTVCLDNEALCALSLQH